MTQTAAPSCAPYERIAQLTSEMLVAARHQQWEHLIELEHACKNAFAGLTSAPNTAPTSPAYAQRKAALIRQVLAHDAEIRKLVEPWVAKLGSWLGTPDQSQRLHDAYHGH